MNNHKIRWNDEIISFIVDLQEEQLSVMFEDDLSTLHKMKNNSYLNRNELSFTWAMRNIGEVYERTII